MKMNWYLFNKFNDTYLKDLFSGIMIFSWRDVLKKALSGGVEVVKIGSKAKIIAVGIAAVLVLGGTGVILWYHHQSAQIAAESAVNQITQKASSKPSVKPVLSKKNISDEQIKKLKNNQNEDAQKEQAIAFLDALGKDEQGKDSTNIIGEGKKDADSERKIMLMSVEEAHRKGAELKVELNSWLNEALALDDEIFGRIDNASRISDPVAKEAEMELSRQASYRQIELIKKIAQWAMQYTFLAEDPDALKPGGWIYEYKMKMRMGNVFW